MKYALLNFLGASLVPVLCSDVSACTAGDIHCCLVCIAAVRALPDKLAVPVLLDLDFTGVTASLAEVALCVELGVHDVVVDVLEQSHYGRLIRLQDS